MTIMSALKTEQLNLRVSSGLKNALKAASEKEQRSMSNMIEFLVATYCKNNNIDLATPAQRKKVNHE